MPAWTLLGTWGIFEYWLAPDGNNVHRRKASAWNVMAPDGAPMGARWESTLAHYNQYVAHDRDDEAAWNAYCKRHLLSV